jgi:hypothetical protein
MPKATATGDHGSWFADVNGELVDQKGLKFKFIKRLTDLAWRLSGRYAGTAIKCPRAA